jgi:hypothetical protein
MIMNIFESLLVGWALWSFTSTMDIVLIMGVFALESLPHGLYVTA